MQLPRVNLNGTSKKELQLQFEEAGQAIQLAISACQRAAPHGRDYQTFADPAWALRNAQTEHAARMRRLLTVLDDYTTLLESVQ